MKSKKAAMFGLDARIALAIFGALSVISGAALYSAVQKAQVVAQVRSIDELVKSIESFMLDTGSYLPEQASNWNIIYGGNIVYNYGGFSNWNGPYWPYTGGNISNINFPMVEKGHTLSSGYRTFRHSGEDWGSSDPTLITGAKSCTSDSCFIYLARPYAASGAVLDRLYQIYLNLDDYVDGGDGAGTGKIRGHGNLVDEFSLYIQLIPEYIKLGS